MFSAISMYLLKRHEKKKKKKHRKLKGMVTWFELGQHQFNYISLLQFIVVNNILMKKKINKKWRQSLLAFFDPVGKSIEIWKGKNHEFVDGWHTYGCIRYEIPTWLDDVINFVMIWRHLATCDSYVNVCGKWKSMIIDQMQKTNNDMRSTQ
jgi:hypothetical protein